MAKTFILHDETVNTYGFRMLTGGADLTEFRKNPVMLLDHNDYNLPIGRWENIRVEGEQILADAVFDMKDERAKQVAGKVEDDFLRAASIGAWAVETSDAAELQYPGQTGATVTRWTVREASVVTIGANHNALALYDTDGNQINLSDKQGITQLFDKTNFSKKSDMKILKGILNLADTATESDVDSAVRDLVANSDRLKAENATLTSRIDALASEAKQREKAEAVALVDAAIKDGRINATAKESYLALFDKDASSAKTVLEAIPVRQSVTTQIEKAKGTSATELADLSAKSWDELDKAEKLTLLKDKYPDLYSTKFTERFGTAPTV
jgi:uncharacterized protein YdbL (DUF1318 family)